MASNSVRIVNHLIGVVAFVMIGVAVGILYVFLVGKVLGAGREGFGLVAAIFMFPFLALTTAVFCWLPMWLLHHHRFGRMSGGRALMLGAVIGFVVALVIAGPSGFKLRGGAPLLNYFIPLLVAIGGLTHNWVVHRMQGPSPGQAS